MTLGRRLRVLPSMEAARILDLDELPRLGGLPLLPDILDARRSDMDPLPLASLGQEVPTPVATTTVPTAPPAVPTYAFIDSPVMSLATDVAASVAAGTLGHTFGMAKAHRWSVFFWVISGMMGLKGAMDPARLQR